MKKRSRHLSCNYDHLWGGSKVLKEWSPHYHYISISRDWVILQYLNLFRSCIRALPIRKWEPLNAFLMKNRLQVWRWIFIGNYYYFKNYNSDLWQFRILLYISHFSEILGPCRFCPSLGFQIWISFNRNLKIEETDIWKQSATRRIDIE